MINGLCCGRFAGGGRKGSRERGAEEGRRGDRGGGGGGVCVSLDDVFFGALGCYVSLSLFPLPHTSPSPPPFPPFPPPPPPNVLSHTFQFKDQISLGRTYVLEHLDAALAEGGEALAGSSTLLRAAHVFISKINESGVVDTATGGFDGVGAIDKVANMSAGEYV